MVRAIESLRQAGYDGTLEIISTITRPAVPLLEQMREDEIGHANTGESMGAAELPPPVKGAMRLMAKVMTETAYRF